MDIIFYFYILPIIISSILLYLVYDDDYDDDSPMTLGEFLNEFKYLLIPIISIFVIIVVTSILIGRIYSNSRVGKYISTKWDKLMNIKIK